MRTETNSQWRKMYGDEEVDYDELDYTEDYYEDEEEENDSDRNSYFCDICKVTCIGIKQYNSHLDGKKHKKKLQTSRSGDPDPNDPASSQLFRCHLCNVTCSGEISYKSHIDGVKHQKALKVQQSSSTSSASSTRRSTQALPKKNFDDTRTGGDQIEISEMDDVEIVGEEFIKEVPNHVSKMKQYYCELCKCPCSDVTVKEAHLRGRPHRNVYKKRVDYDLDVESKGSQKSKFMKEKLRKVLMANRQKEVWNMRATYQGQLMPTKPESVMIDATEPVAMFGLLAPINKACMLNRLPDENFIKAVYASLCPKESETVAITKALSAVELSLKNISDYFCQENESLGSFKSGGSVSRGRTLLGVVRVGPYAESVMLRGEATVELVIVCKQKPTHFLARKVADMLQEMLTKDKFEVRWEPNNSVMVISSTSPRTSLVLLSFTHLTMRDADSETSSTLDPHDVIDSNKCLEALAKIRRTKWFQARGFDLKNCVMIVRLMRDVCNRMKWRLSLWALELLVKKALITAGTRLVPLEAFRRVFEALAAGALLPDAPGLADPCENESVDALSDLIPQERENMTMEAQVALRYIAFGQIEKVIRVHK